VTALGSTTMTNNIAEFVGLHRMLAHTAGQGWSHIHVVGDSAMILRLMRNRIPPKSRKLQHWYQAAIRLAGICRVSSWTHHYREYNKMMDWLANQAMDSRSSVMMALTAETTQHWMHHGVAERLGRDITQWNVRGEQRNR
jgi:ribonuclease HI